MPLIKIKPLEGLAGLPEQEREAFKNKQIAAGLLSKSSPDEYFETLYRNGQFIDKFGMDAFRSTPDIELRNTMLNDKLIEDAFEKQYKPRDNHEGLGADYEKYFGQVDPVTGQRMGGMSSNGMLKLLESDYLTPSEFEERWKSDIEESKKNAGYNEKGVNAFVPGTAFTPVQPIMVEYNMNTGFGETLKQARKAHNDRILERIYGEDGEEKAAGLGDIVSQAYLEPSIVGDSDEETVKLFKEAITPSRVTGNMGIPEYASHYGIVDGEGISSEMEGFSINDMREVLAKKAVYDRYMSPDMAATVLNNEAKRYIHDHQGFDKKAALFAKDVVIAATSYTADKFNAFYNMGLMAADAFGDKPVVWVDTKGNVIDTNKTRLFGGADGNLYYQNEDGDAVPVHQEQIARTTLHNMGRNMDGSVISDPSGVWYKDMWTLDPQYWTRAEQFGTLDANLQKQYEQLGSSPYKVAYNPNEDRDLLYESFKMMSFGLADAGMQLIPFGIGAAGKALSTASNVGRVARGLGKVTHNVSKYLVAGEGLPGRIGAAVQGLAGAGGIAEAYQRGAFQETLAQNMANLEQTVADRSKSEVTRQYNEDEAYKKALDGQIEALAAAKKDEYMAKLGEEGQQGVLNEQLLDEMFYSQARAEVFNEQAKDKARELQASDEYATMQEEAINSAGQAATNTFWPEAIKYSLVNTIGFRKYLYTTPTSVMQKAANNFKGLREITTSAGRKRLATDAYKTLTNAEKWKTFGKVAGGQIWGGAWTNGTDDMMVDAAERINEDSFNRYLHAYENGEALADTYGFADGLFSYWMGLQNSLGQETTGEAALIGGLGSTISGNLHFTNIASLATKEGREAYRNNFQQRYKRDADGMLVKGEDGKPIVEKIGWKENWRDRLGFFIQNGVLNEYYGKKQNLRNLQEHADYVNNILDDMDDFEGIESLISSDIGRENAINIGDEKTMRFVHAFNAINALENLGKDEKDPSTLSSVVMQHKDMIERASKLGTEESDMTEEEVNNLLGQYYSNNPGLAQSEENNQIILQNIAQNARKLQEAYEAYNKAEESIQALEKEKGAPIIAPVRFRMKMSQALDEHWKERLETMREEVGDASSSEPTTGEALIAAVGGKRRADGQLKAFAFQENMLLQGVATAVSQQQKMLDAYNQAQQVLRNAEEKGDSEAILQAQKDLKEAQDNYNEAIEERMFREDLLTSAREKQQRLQEAVEAWEKGTKSRVLTADEIMSLDPVTRAKMLEDIPIDVRTGEKMEDPYSPAQRKQIEKLKARLKTFDKTGDPLQKIQDIALLTQRIAQNEDAYHRLSRNPDAAAVQLEKQQKEAAEYAVQLINQRNAETLANYINEMNDALVGRKDVSQRMKNDYVYNTLRNKNPKLLDIIEQNNLLPQYYPQVQKAKEWAHVTSDIDAVLSNMDRDEAQGMAFRTAIDKAIEPASSRDEIIANLEKEVDNNVDPQRQKDYEELLEGLSKMGYQRNATVIESRKQRKEREEAQKKAEEERKAKLEAAVKEAAEKQAAEDAKRKAEEEERKKRNDAGINSSQPGQSVEGQMGVDLGDIGLGETGTPAAKPQGTVEGGTKPIDTLVAWAEGKMSVEDARKQLDGTEYVKHTKDNPLLHTKGGVYFTNAVERDLGKYITEKYPFLTYGRVSVNTGVSTFGGSMNLTVIRDAESNEYGTPSNFLRSLATNPKGKAAEVVKKGLEAMQQGKSDVDKLVELWEIYSALGTKDIPKTLNDIGYQMTDIVEAERLFKEKHPEGVPEITEEEAKELAETLGIQQNQGTAVSNTVEVHDETLGDVIQGKSPTLDEQVTEAQREGQDVQIVTDMTDEEKENDRGEQEIETSPTTLSGNAMAEYEPQALKEHRLVHKRGSKPDDSMNQFYDWLKNAGIKLQNIIDDELPQILEQNPHAPIKFMRLRPSDKVVKDDFRAGTLMLVTDYDDKVNRGITSIHSDDNGGVITSGGKKYLIVGTAGYGNKEKTPDKYNLWKMLMDDYAPNSHKLRLKAWDWFKRPENRAELYYVHPDFHTEVVPNSMIPGYLIRQNETGEAEPSRKISELLEDAERNPHHLTLDKMAWGIQTLTGFSVINAGSKANKILRPQDVIDNSGRVFALVPAGNGKLVPVKIEALKYNDTKFNKNGALFRRIQDLLNQVTSPNRADRNDAISKLVQVLYFSKEKDGDNILIGQDEHDNRITVVHGNQRTTFFLDSNFNRGDFFKAIEDMNPRINVTAQALLNKQTLRELDEAGALMVDVAKLGTSGISYSIYGIDAAGEMIAPAEQQRASSEPETTFQEKNVRAFPYLHGETYRYNTDTGKFTLNGVEITNDDMIEYAYKIAVGELTSVKQKGVWNYYIISTGENPEVVRQSNSTKAVERIGKEEAQEIINEEVARVEEEKRKLALEQALAEQEEAQAEEGTINEEDGSLDFFSNEFKHPEEEKKEEAPAAPQPQATQSVEGQPAESKTLTFKQVWRGPNRSKLLDVLRQKDWENIPMDNMAELKKYLEGKGINVDAIGDFDAWLQRIACK